MTLAQLLESLREKRAAAMAKLQGIMELAAAEDRCTTPEEAAEYTTLDASVKAYDADIQRCDERIQAAAANATASIVASATQTAQATVVARATQAVHAPAIISARSISDTFEGQTYVRTLIAQALGRVYQVSAIDVAKARWGNQSAAVVHALSRPFATAVPGGGTSTWMAEMLDIDSTQDFITYLRSKTLFDSMNLRPLAPYVTVGGQDQVGTGYWVAEGAGIGVNTLSLLTVSLTPLKMGAIKAVTKESLRVNTAFQEKIIRDDLVASAVQLIDSRFFSTTAAGTGSPAGIFNGVSPTASVGGQWEGVVADIKNLVATFVAAKNVSGLRLFMNPATALTIGSLRNDMSGNKMFPDLTINGGTLENIPVATGDNIGAAVVALIKEDEIYSVQTEGPQLEISVSDQATIEMNDTPLGNVLTPTAATANPVSMFQTESVAFKIVRPVNYAKRRSHAVAFINDADYSAAAPTA
jgi:hypothetical protein